MDNGNKVESIILDKLTDISADLKELNSSLNVNSVNLIRLENRVEANRKDIDFLLKYKWYLLYGVVSAAMLATVFGVQLHEAIKQVFTII